MGKHHNLLGDKTVYGVMPDWNPAEIIGIRPRPLALSLYRELITDNIWAYQRSNYGYRNLRSFPLMINFFGLPYIDVRLSFNSFIPAQLEETTANKLTNYYMNKLLLEPVLHDKIEFEIVFSCFTFDLKERLKILKKHGFTQAELNSISNNLLKITNNILKPKKGLLYSDSLKLNILLDRRKELFKAKSDELDKIFWLLEDTKRFGTLPFAGIARAGFVAVQLLQSLVSTGIFTDNDYETLCQV